MNSLDRAVDALKFIPPDDRDCWVKMGMALKSEFGESAFQPWIEWSAQADSFDVRTAGEVWRSIQAEGGITIGSLFHEAKAYGWRDAGHFQKATPEKRVKRAHIVAELSAMEESDLARERANTAEMAATILRASREVSTDNPYLASKQVFPTSTLREIDAFTVAEIGFNPKSSGHPLVGRLLVVPVKQDERLATLELIDGEKRKCALPGRGTKRGGYWANQRLPEGDGTNLTLLIGEGVATNLSAFEACGHQCIASLSDGNLPAVAVAMRKRYPNATLVILADLVKATGTPNRHAIAAAKAVGGKLAVPDFGAERPEWATDFNDMALMFGAEAVAESIKNASASLINESQSEIVGTLRGEDLPGLSLIRASSLNPEPIQWVWPGWLARGKLHVFGGAPSAGKTTITLSFAAKVTTGGWWPDGSRSPIGNVVIWSGEDDPADTLVPRLILAGADLTRVYFIADIREGSDSRPFDPARDMAPLRKKLSEIGDVLLLIVDPIVSSISGDSHKNAEVRRGLQPLVELTASVRCALLGITHFSKGTAGRDPVERLTGSLAFGAMARVVLVAAKQQQTDGENMSRILCRAKSNIGPDDGAWLYEVEQEELSSHAGIVASRVRWGGAMDGAARELLAMADTVVDESTGSSLADAKQYLAQRLGDGPVPATSIKADATAAGFSWATMRRAQAALGVESRKKEGQLKGPWYWRLPGLGSHENDQSKCEGAQKH